ncbi:MAG: hypothetical protein IPO78_13660 [Saprospiraceae bacterium]|nr:hypothetical protein [Saprospiraceae bacterium]
MKYFWILLIISIGCTNTDYDEKVKFHSKELDLIDKETEPWSTFSKVSMLVPDIFDTLIIWKDPLWCSGFYSFYRFTNKNYCLIQESSMYGKYCKKNYFHFTIRHGDRSSMNQYTNLKYFTEEINEINYRKSLDLYSPLINWSRIALVQIKNRDWYIARGFDYECDVDYSRELLYAKTLLNNRWIYFNLECKLNSCICFDSIASKMIYSVNFVTTKNK